MSESLDFNPALPESRQFTPPAEGGNGNIHKPGDYHNLIWQTRSRVPENWELQLIATLETLFEQGAESLGELVNGLNGVRMHDQQGEPWSESSFQAFLQVMWGGDRLCMDGSSPRKQREALRDKA
ncbi:hypothetical protein WP7S17E08_06880 [Klebsiella quasipneumoniae]|nr:hypothetical protein WP7S17E08_06880 [Klebsiella quasipneumoniae]